MNFSKEEKAMWLEDWRQSGKKACTYAKENGLIPQTFCSWAKRERESATGFVEIPAPMRPKQEEPQEITLEKGDLKIRIPFALWTKGFREIMEGLRVIL